MAFLPTTTPGRWALWLMVANVVLMFSWRLLGPLGALPGFVAGLAAGILALTAILRRHERAVVVFVAVLPLVFVVVFVLAELLIGHD